MKKEAKNAILELTFQFALKIMEFSELLERKRKFVIARQVLKSGSSIGANVHGAQSPESKADFIHKMKMAAKEAEETTYWLRLCKFAASYPDPGDLFSELDSIQKLLSKIISVSKRNL